MTWSPPRTRREVFEAIASGVASGDPGAAELYRRCADDPLALSLLPDEPTWDMPHRLLAGARWLVLADEADEFEQLPGSWRAFRKILEERSEWLASWVASQPVQTNEPQRCWALLPLFLAVGAAARRPLDLLELGASAGLNLVWDRHRYEYRAGSWGPRDAVLSLAGDERAPVPAGVLDTTVEIRSRRGIDLAPVDATTDEGIRLLDAFVRDEGYRVRVRAAAAALRTDPPELIEGDYLEVLPALLRERSPEALTVLFQTHSTVYLSDDERRRLRAIVDEAAGIAPLAWISTPTPDEHGERRGDYPLELALWPGGDRRIVARTDVRGSWLEWDV